jgi:hypothetical protein
MEEYKSINCKTNTTASQELPATNVIRSLSHYSGNGEYKYLSIWSLNLPYQLHHIPNLIAEHTFSASPPVL